MTNVASFTVIIEIELVELHSLDEIPQRLRLEAGQVRVAEAPDFKIFKEKNNRIRFPCIPTRSSNLYSVSFLCIRTSRTQSLLH